MHADCTAAAQVHAHERTRALAYGLRELHAVLLVRTDLLDPTPSPSSSKFEFSQREAKGRYHFRATLAHRDTPRLHTFSSTKRHFPIRAWCHKLVQFPSQTGLISSIPRCLGCLCSDDLDLIRHAPKVFGGYNTYPDTFSITNKLDTHLAKILVKLRHAVDCSSTCDSGFVSFLHSTKNVPTVSLK